MEVFAGRLTGDIATDSTLCSDPKSIKLSEPDWQMHGDCKRGDATCRHSVTRLLRVPNNKTRWVTVTAGDPVHKTADQPATTCLA